MSSGSFLQLHASIPCFVPFYVFLIIFEVWDLHACTGSTVYFHSFPLSPSYFLVCCLYTTFFQLFIHILMPTQPFHMPDLLDLV